MFIRLLQQVVFLFLILSALPVCSQHATSEMDSLAKRLHDHAVNIPEVTAYIRTEKGVYEAGEDLPVFSCTPPC